MRATLGLPFTPKSSAMAREFVADHTHDVPAAVGQDAELLTSELVTNAVRYGEPAIVVQLTVSDETVAVNVSDDGCAMPVLPAIAPPASSASGRGLLILGAVANRWGVTPHYGRRGKTVWFERRP